MAGLIGMVTGFSLVLAAMTTSFISGGLVTIFLLLLRLRKRRDTLPFAPFLALGAIVALSWGKELITWYLGFYP